jgi:hypothetical protein
MSDYTLGDGKYFIRRNEHGLLTEITRHNEPWPAAEQLVSSKIFHSALDEIDALRARQAVLVEALTPAFKAIDAISANPNDMQRRRDAEVNCFYAVQRARAALAQEKQGEGEA